MLRTLFTALFSLMLASLAVAQDKCDLTDRHSMTALSPAEFFALPAGSLAIGEGCNPSARTCKSYLDITGCQNVDYAISESGSPGRLNLSVNPTTLCEGECELLDSFLMVAMTLPHSAQDETARFVGLMRNSSDRWNRLGGGKLSQQVCCDGATVPKTFIDIHKADDSKELSRRTKMNWHSAMSPSDSNPIETFAHRKFFVDALESCGDCSMKAFLLRFLETDGNKSEGKPLTPLFFSAMLQSFDRVNVDIMAPRDEVDAYEHDLVVNIIH